MKTSTLAGVACVVCCLAFGRAGAAPSVSSVSGGTTQGSTSAISGSGFGAGDTTPLLWDDFENGTAGSNLSGSPKVGAWDLNGSPTSVYSTAQKHAGGKSAFAWHDDSHQWSNFNVYMPPADRVYQTFWFRYDASGPGQAKLSQIHGDAGMGDFAPGVMTGGFTGDWWASYISTETGSHSQLNYPFTPTRNQWHRCELILQRSSSGGVADGLVIIRIDGTDVYNVANKVTRAYSQYNWNMAEFFCGMTNFGAYRETYIDDAYLNNSWARVEIGNAATWAGCTQKEIQIPSAWSDTSITVTVNLGSLSSPNTYLYVVDANGAFNSSGYLFSSRPTYSLTVNSGGGDGTYLEGAVVNISADAPATGKTFTRWTGDTAGVADVNAASTTLTMPARDATITATYADLPRHDLTVNSGAGGGNYYYGQVVSVSANAAPSGSLFDRWTGGTACLANVLAASTTVTMPDADVTITATFGAAHTLTVNSGTGGGAYVEGRVVTIVGNAPASGMLFAGWTGNTSNLADPASRTTTVAMPAANVTVTATYTPATICALTVHSGTGSGNYQAGAVVAVSANSPPTSTRFYKWVPDTAPLADAYSAGTTVTMPAANVEITATYQAVTLMLIADFGGPNSTPPNVLPFENWTTVFMGIYTYYSAAGPAGIAGGSTGTNAVARVSGSQSHAFHEGDQIVATWYNSHATASFTFTPRISFTDMNEYDAGSTWYSMSQVASQAPGQTRTSLYTVTSGAAASYPRVNVCRYTSLAAEGVLLDKMELLVPTLYTLTVNSGTGSGAYAQGTVVNIAANAAPSGKIFAGWISDTALVAAPAQASTTVTMPAGAVSVTATYVPVYQLTVNSGTGDGQYKAGAVVAIQADAAPSSMEFDEWTGDTARVAAPAQASTTVTIPAAAVSVTATYVSVYQLTVNSGTGDGQYKAGTVVAIQADAAASGKEFDQWTGDTAAVADASAAATTITMPASDAEVTATYSVVVPPLLGDLNGDGFVGQGDLNIVLSQWGKGAPPHDPIIDPRADANHDGFVGQGDLNIVLAHWGEGTLP